MGLVDDEIRPCEFVEYIAVEIANFVSRDAYIPLAKLIPLPRLQDVRSDVETLVLVSMELDHIQFGRPALKLIHPIAQS